MYRYSNGQISLSDFKQPVGMNLKETNRWVKKAQTIPWTEIEKRYAALFTNRKGNVAKPLRLALGACIIQAEYGYSDEEIALQIQENPYLQYFLNIPAPGNRRSGDLEITIPAGRKSSFRQFGNHRRGITRVFWWRETANPVKRVRHSGELGTAARRGNGPSVEQRPLSNHSLKLLSKPYTSRMER